MIPEDALTKAWDKYLTERGKRYGLEDEFHEYELHYAFMSGALAMISLQSQQLSEDLGELRALVAHLTFPRRER